MCAQGKAEAYAKSYEELAASALLGILQADLRQPAPANVTSDKAARQACKDRWTAVNAAVLELLGQAGWAVPDAALRYSIKDALADAVVPLYEALLTKYRSVPFSESRAKYVRWTSTDLSTAIQGMFEGVDTVLAASPPPPARSVTRIASLRRGWTGT